MALRAWFFLMIFMVWQQELEISLGKDGGFPSSGFVETNWDISDRFSQNFGVAFSQTAPNVQETSGTICQGFAVFVQQYGEKWGEYIISG